MKISDEIREWVNSSRIKTLSKLLELADRIDAEMVDGEGVDGR